MFSLYLNYRMEFAYEYIMEDKKSSISNIIDALTKIENNHLNSNRNNAIYSMLKEIGL